jgi:hypothetical protein
MQLDNQYNSCLLQRSNVIDVNVAPGMKHIAFSELELKRL